MALTNRPGGLLVTRGLGGPTTQVIVRGFLPLLTDQIVDAVRGARIAGRRAKDKYQDFLEELKISVALVSINGKDLLEPIINTIRTTYEDKPTPRIEVTPTKLSVKKPDIKVEVKSVRSKNDSN